MVYRPAHRFRIGRRQVEENGILRCPWRYRGVETTREQPLALTVVAVERHLIDTERTKHLARRQTDVRAHLGRHFKQARGVQTVVALRRVGRFLHPFFGYIGLTLGETACTLIIALNVYVRKHETVLGVAGGGFGLEKRKLFHLERIDRDAAVAPVDHFEVFPDNRQTVVDGHMEFHRQLRQPAAPEGEHHLLARGIGGVERPAVAFPTNGRLHGTHLEVFNRESTVHRAQRLNP